MKLRACRTAQGRRQRSNDHVDPAPELSDETLIETVRFPTILRNALMSAGLKSIGEYAPGRMMSWAGSRGSEKNR